MSKSVDLTYEHGFDVVPFSDTGCGLVRRFSFDGGVEGWLVAGDEGLSFAFEDGTEYFLNLRFPNSKTARVFLDSFESLKGLTIGQTLAHYGFNLL